jgi:DNA sulfur modification protein DndB
VNKSRIPKIAEYLHKYHDDYVLPPIIASIDGDAHFQPLSEQNENLQVGVLHIPESADFIINDGQHRCAAIKQVLQKKPELKFETLGVVFYIDRGVKRARQMFSDLNGHPVRTNQNINATFDNRQYLPLLTKRVMDSSHLLLDRVELFASSCAIGSPKIYTISALNKTHKILLQGLMTQDIESDSSICCEFWKIMEEELPEISNLIEGTINARHIKENYIFTYSIGLQGLAATANQLLHEKPKQWTKKLRAISKIDWKRTNPEWEGRAMSAGRLTTGGNHPTLTKNFIKKRLSLELSAEEQKVETQLIGERQEVITKN